VYEHVTVMIPTNGNALSKFISRFHHQYRVSYMAQSRPSKRARVGEAFHDIVPLAEDYSIVHARDGRLKRVGNSVRTAPTNRTAHHESNNTWNTTESWTPFDDPEFALDPNGDSYDEVLNQEVMEESTKGLPPPKQRTRSAVSVRHFFLMIYSLLIFLVSS
jgi:hypothetical protein